MDDPDLIAQLRTAIEHRTEIGIAIGMLMERRGLDRDGAFLALCDVSSRTNRKLYDIAREMSDTGVVPDVDGHATR